MIENCRERNFIPRKWQLILAAELPFIEQTFTETSRLLPPFIVLYKVTIQLIKAIEHYFLVVHVCTVVYYAVQGGSNF